MPVPKHFITQQTIAETNRIGRQRLAELRARKEANVLIQLAMCTDPVKLDQLIKTHRIPRHGRS